MAIKPGAMQNKKTVKSILEEVYPFITWSYIARVYMGQSGAWLYDRLNGKEIFTDTEVEDLQKGLLSLANTISQAVSNLK